MVYHFLIIGCGGREHALAQAILSKTQQKVELITLGTYKNPGLFNLSTYYLIADSITDPNKVIQAIHEQLPKDIQIDVAIVGPEAPLEKGVADILWKNKIPTVGPCQDFAKIETSKSFTRRLLHSIDCNEYNPDWITVVGKSKLLDEDIRADSPEFNRELIQTILETQLDNQYVIKADGLRGGKGVKLSGSDFQNVDQALEYGEKLIEEDGFFLIEEKLEGQEFSLMSLVDGQNIKHFPPVQDYKRAFDQDHGPNTGGMGSISHPDHLLPFLDHDDLTTAQEINFLVTRELIRRYGRDKTFFNQQRRSYKGILYGSFMKTTKGKIKVIEYNCRFGDPEVLNLMSIIDESTTDVVDLFLSIINKTLNRLNLNFKNEWTICRYVCPEGYPSNPVKNQKIDITPLLEYELADPQEIIYASVEEGESLTRPIMKGSRAIALVMSDRNLDHLLQRMNNALEHIKGPIFYRTDIGTRFLPTPPNLEKSTPQAIKTQTKQTQEKQYSNNSTPSLPSSLPPMNNLKFSPSSPRILNPLANQYQTPKHQNYFRPIPESPSQSPNKNRLSPCQYEIETETESDDRSNNNMSNHISPITYQESGVDVDEAERGIEKIKYHVKSTHTDSVINDYGSFTGIFRNVTPNSESCLVSSMDGLGTKVQTLLYLMDYSRSEAFYRLGRDLVTCNINDLICVGRNVKPLFFLDYFSTNKLNSTELEIFVQGISHECVSSNCVLIGGETAEIRQFHLNDHSSNSYQPPSIEPATYEMVGTIVGEIKRSEIFNPQEIQANDLLISLPSTGLHTNGYSLVNRLLKVGRYQPTSQEIEDLTQTHYNYYPQINQLYQKLTPIQQRDILGLAHITGGGLLANLERVIPKNLTPYLYDDAYQIPEIFLTLQKHAHISREELMKTFNCGIGMIVIVRQNQKTTEILDVIGKIFPKAQIIGHLIEK